MIANVVGFQIICHCTVVLSKKWSMFWDPIHVFWNSKLAISLKWYRQPLQTDDKKTINHQNTAKSVVWCDMYKYILTQTFLIVHAYA